MTLEEVINKAIAENGGSEVKASICEAKEYISYIKGKKLYKLDVSGLEELINWGEDTIIDIIKSRMDKLNPVNNA